MKLKKEILDLFYSRFRDFNEVQKLAIPEILKGKNTLIIAPTGSGKCVHPNTKVLTLGGYKKIKNIKSIVYLKSFEKFRIKNSIGFKIVKPKERFYLVETETGFRIRVTKNHRFLTRGGFKELKNIGFSEVLVYEDSFYFDKIEKIKKVGKEKVIDFYIPFYHNYISNGFVSHNTEASVLPVFHKILEIKEKEQPKGILAMYITPLRALNRDLLDRLYWWAENLNISIAVRHGDTPQSERAKQSRRPPEFLITTPETFQILFTGKRLKEHLKTVKFVIIDELHELLDDKRGVQLSLGLERLVNFAGEFQRIALSATIGDPELAAKFIFGNRDYTIAQWYGKKKYKVEVLYPEITKEDEELAKKLGWHPKVVWSIRKIKEILDSVRTAIIFVNTREMAELLASRFKRMFPEYPIEIHHSSLSKEVREKNEKLLKEGKLKAIIATSSLELGIDIGHVDLVIQYMSPRQVTRLIQRIGRSKHKLEEVSEGYIITLDPDDYFESLAIKNMLLDL